LGKKRNAYRILVGMPEGKKPLWRKRCGWGNNIKIDLTEIGWGSMGWIHLAQDRRQWRALVNMVMNLWVHEMLKNSWAAEPLVAPQGLSSMELISISSPLDFYLGRPDRMHSRNASFYIHSKDAFSHCNHLLTMIITWPLTHQSELQTFLGSTVENTYCKISVVISVYKHDFY
jgi:hypothetical protein